MSAAVPAPVPAPAPFTLVVDTREQAPYTFGPMILGPGGRPVDVRAVRATLPAGDYSLLGLETRFAIERKSPADAYSTFSRGRDRFVRELERLRSYSYAAILIEASLRDLLTPPPHVERVRPATVINSLCSWSIEYGVHVLYAGDRDLARALVVRLAERFWRQHEHAAPKPTPAPT